MHRRRWETRLAYFTLGALLIYAPIETIYSWPGGLSSPYYLVDLVAMALMLTGAIHSLGARPRSSPGLMTAGWSWAGANFWRAMFDRIGVLRRGGQLDYGSIELRFVCAETAVALACVIAGVVLLLRARHD
jgi:hypothetical protein